MLFFKGGILSLIHIFDAQYAKEQDALEIEIAELEKAVTGYEQSQKSAEKFIALIDKYENFDTLTNTMLNEFVEKILVHERSRKGSQDTTQMCIRDSTGTIIIYPTRCHAPFLGGLFQCHIVHFAPPQSTL